MVKSKYIIIEEYGLQVPIVFNPILNHKDVAGEKKVISAGFCKLEEPNSDNRCYVEELDSLKSQWIVWGESDSLKVSSRLNDGEILNELLSMDV